MTDYIKREDAVFVVLQQPFFQNSMATEIRQVPSIDIVKCKECKHWIGETEHYEDREYKACWQLCGQYMNSEFWCKYGERKSDE